MSDAFWHGGGRIDGDMILPPERTGRSRSGDHGVFVCTDRGLAEVYASTVPDRTAWVYQVELVGPLEPVPSNVPGRPTVSYRCAEARILKRFTVSAARRRECINGVAWAAGFPTRPGSRTTR